MAALNPIKPLYSTSATATNGSSVVIVTGNVDCSWLKPGSIVQLGTRQLVDAISGTAPDGSGNSTITLRRNWVDPTTTAPLLAFMSWEGLADVVVKLRALADANESALQGAFSFSGSWDASSGDLPPTPATGSQIYRISIAGSMGGRNYRVGEGIYYDQYVEQWRSTLELITAFSAGVLEKGTSAEWRTALGLIKADSKTDSTVGRLLQVGDNGIQTEMAFLHQALAVPASTNVNITAYPRGATALENGYAYTVQLTTSGTGVNTGAKYHVRQSGAGVFQLLAVSDFTGTNQPRLGITSGNILQVSQGGGSTQIVHVAIEARFVGNTTAISPYYFGLEGVIGSKNNGVPAFTVAGVPTYDLYHQNNIVGTVSQSGGIPTGAIVQRGSNANGEFVRVADGTQICWLNQTAGFSAPAAYGSGLYRSAKTVDYPAAFNSNSFITGGGWASDNAAEGWCVLRNSSASSGVLQYFTPTASPSSREVRATVFGRWF